MVLIAISSKHAEGQIPRLILKYPLILVYFYPFGL